MTKRSLSPILLVFAAVGIGCGSEACACTVFEPERPSVFTTLEVSPTVADLSIFAPENTIQLTTVASDQRGAPMSGTGATTFSSSAPAIAGVDRSGFVRATAPGTAVITASLTLGGITRTASVTARVHGDEEPSGNYAEMAGVYDLTAPVTSYEWGISDGTHYTAVLTIQPSLGRRRFTGTISDFRVIEPPGDTSRIDPGFVYGTIDPDARVEFQLITPRFTSWYGQGTLASGQIVGTFGCCDAIFGTFTAKRRQPE